MYRTFAILRMFPNLSFSCIRSESTVLLFLSGPPFVNKDELSSTYMTRYLIFNEKLLVIFRSENGGSTVLFL